ncbi:GHKL domain-containing protein [Adhaeribacter swui]|uniref:histidine kinase n=1 Tax=Adhaeribacter swui TaxID=2086471 RepID=A0A7G7GBB4_9BACT|nr:ATP-binding protein [Adhaeribacter swui]QNF34448.1 GHKL domain-containing protein [Adhaeribacter swui]
MYFFTLLSVFLLLRRLRKSNVTSPKASKWDQWLNVSSWISLGLMFSLGSFLTDEVSNLGASIFLWLVLFFLYTEPDFHASRPIVYSFIPFAVITFISAFLNLIVPEFYQSLEGYLTTAIMGAFVWNFASWINANKQEKELEFERQQRIQEEQQKLALSAQKDQLEILVAERTSEITKQKEELEVTVQELKATQAQLIQQEKLASLGELTAGIAHEIQNPLNFVNNFSEVSTELLQELKEGPLQKLPESEKEYAEEILFDLTQNLNKISHHGQRADKIVKGMLQHSRATTGQKEPTDINALADEYLRLSYHGLRAKDKSFNATIKTDFAPDLGLVNIVSQDVGRVLLNLYNNAFYAISEKKKLQNGTFEPTICVTTQQKDGKIEIRVKDNGLGIPAAIREKIMQPFFTTKPAGKGTGLGLSLSYDIITKVHGGSLEVNTQEGEFSEFILRLPRNNK